MKDKIKALLGQGHSAELVATIIGCDPSYISQLLEDEAFRNEVSELRVRSLQAASARDKKWDDLEDKLLDKLHSAVDFVIKPREILAVLSAANAAKRRGATAHESVTINNQIVNLLVPQRLVQTFTVNQNNQVIGVGDKSMLTLPSTKIADLYNNINGQKSQPAQQPLLGEVQNALVEDKQSDPGDRKQQSISNRTNAAEKESQQNPSISRALSKRSIADYTAEELKELL